ncbi:type IV pilus biogenesis/stability protein PilW [Gallaecimonas kandeliae]|uniref:type IV pilus biogenesis/stability protein PilW n=1 Tax=Gallaecimonas kandeliae TaxID=3029055 RepID=UPI002647C22B|nr:type IV pilus biogenesis/stability protein PilW [Gallaecimonas kandeliae]WKE64662.1 type IV pilus biogenesis/stability protein PilW [Gallaecimonas kandeliae]
MAKPRYRLGFLALLLALGGCVSQTLDSQGNVVAEKPFDPIAAAKSRMQLGLAYLRSGNSAQAKMNLLKAQEFAPDLPDVYYSLGYYYQAVGESKEAEEAYRHAIKLDPENGEALNNFGAFLCGMGRFDESIEYFTKAVRAPGYIKVAGAYENAGTCAKQGGDLDGAEKYFASALSHDARRAASLLGMAETLYAKKDFIGAKGYLGRFEGIARPVPRSLFLGLELAKRTGDDAGVQRYGDELVSKYPDSPLSQQYRSNKY